MVSNYTGHYPYNNDTLTNWNYALIGVYYVGSVHPTTGNLVVHYIGRAIGDGGIRGRLLQHSSERKWLDATHFGYRQCGTAQEAIDLEVAEIASYSPKYNTVGIL